MKWRELDPFPSPLDDPRSVLAVKGPLRRVPRPGPLRADPKRWLFTRKKGGWFSGFIPSRDGFDFGFLIRRFIHSSRRSYYL